MYTSKTIEIGNIFLGGKSPVVIQSMTNTNTREVEATIAQCIRIFDKGADMVRITTPSLEDVKSLNIIRDKLREKDYTKPLVADVHFQPKVAIEAAKIVEKVRINPGNYLPGKYKGPTKYDAGEQKVQQQLIRERILPLIDTCRKYDTAIRIGVNHGSLSERILNWYGNTPEGMVESAMEFLSIFQKEKFEKVVVSLKASSSRVMVYANRLLVTRMNELEMNYPLHLGVTEAGDEEAGRIKSAVGICSLLNDGIGDTIRVSLTENPEEEIPVAQLITRISLRKPRVNKDVLKPPAFLNLFRFRKRPTFAIRNIGGDFPPVVISSIPTCDPEKLLLGELGFILKNDGTMESQSTSPDYIYYSGNELYFHPPKEIHLIIDAERIDLENLNTNTYPLFEAKQGIVPTLEQLYFQKISSRSRPDKFGKNAVILLEIEDKSAIGEVRDFFMHLHEINCTNPVVLYRNFRSENLDELMIKASSEPGSMILDGLGDGIWIEEENPDIPPSQIREISFNILQACSARISKTEYISCPSCGRTLFDIQASMKKIKQATSEFKGLKIAVMGCIVNGPGEMADADFGYIGAGHGKVSLYKGRKEVLKNVPEESAVEELLKLIRKYHS